MTPKLLTDRLVLREIKGADIFGYYEIFSDPQTMALFGGPILTNDLDYKDFVQQMKHEREKGISYLWTITLKEEKEFIGFVRLMSYNSDYFDASFSSIGKHRYNDEFLKNFDRENGWEIDYALIKSQRKKGIMREAVGTILDFCKVENLSPIYAKVNSMANTATVNVLRALNFQDYLPQIGINFLGNFDPKKTIESNEIGMIFKWEAGN